MHVLTSALIAGGFALALLSVVYLALRTSIVTVCLLLVVWVLTVALRDSVDLSLTLSGVRISALDVISTVLAVVGLVRVVSRGVRTFGLGLALALLLFLAVHIARGASDFGIQTAVNDARGWLYFTAALLYAATVPGGWDKRIWKIFAAVGAILAAIAIPYMFVDGLHSATQQLFRNGAWVSARPVDAAGALLILQSAIIAPAIGWPSRRSAVWVTVGAGSVVILLQHRTVWVAGLVVALVGFASWSWRRVNEAQPLVFAATGVVLLALPIAVWGFSRAGTLVTSAKEATAANSTFTWRTTSWTELIASHHSSSQVALGQGSGSDWSRLINGQVIDRSPHDGFVDAYLRFGIPGVLVLCMLGLVLLRGRRRIGNLVGLSSRGVALLLVTQFLFSIAYTLDSIQGAIAGILVSGLAVAAPSFREGAARAKSPTLRELAHR